MLNLPVLRWGKPYESLETDTVVHFRTGEPIAKVGQSNGGLLQRDMRLAKRARDVLRDIAPDELICDDQEGRRSVSERHAPDGRRAANARRIRPPAVGLDRPARAHVQVQHAEEPLRAHEHGPHARRLTRGLDPRILSRGYGMESRGVIVSYQAQSPVLGLVLPSNSPGVHTLWLPVIPMQIGLVLKPGPQEPWTPYRMTAAFVAAGIPPEAISIYPGVGDVGAAVLANVDRSMIFGGTATVERYKGNPKVQAHGPGFSKILLGDDCVDDWEKYIDLMVDSVYLNSGRGCINCSGIWASRHTKEIAKAMAERIGPVEALPPEDPKAGLAAFTVPGAAQAIWKMIDSKLKEPGVWHATGEYGPRLVEMERCAYLRPTVVQCDSPERQIAKEEYMFPFTTVVECPQEKMIEAMGPTLVGTAITHNAKWAPGAERLHAHRPAQHRPHADDQAELAATARRQHRRVPVPRPRFQTLPEWVADPSALKTP